MSSTTYIGQKLRSFDSAPQFDGFSKVIIRVSDEVEYSAGNDSGRTMTLENPWGTQEMANRILARIKGFQYQPYVADGAKLDPAAELGDAVTANNTHGGIYTRQETFGPHMNSAISAPEDEEIDHEYKYVSKQDRTIKRNMRELTAELKVQAGLISAEVSERKSAIEEAYGAIAIQAGRIDLEVLERKSAIEEAYGAIAIQAGRIDLEVSERKSAIEEAYGAIAIQAGLIEARVTKTGGDFSSFGWVLDEASWTIKGNNRDILKATADGMEVYGKITATSGQIGGFNINSNSLSYNNQTWGGTNSTGIYIGTSGIQLGNNFKVDSAGNLTASSGKFTGTVYAGNIQYGKNEGYFSGYGINSGTINGNRLEYNTVGTSYVSNGIRSSLANADFAADAFDGYEWVGNLFTGKLKVSGTCEMFGHKIGMKTAAVATPSGGSMTIYYLGYS